MDNESLVPAPEFCHHYNIEVSFLRSLREYELIELTTVESTEYIPSTQLPLLEQFIRLHYDLQINFEGIDAVSHLLNQLHSAHEEINTLKSRLRLYHHE